MRTVRRVPRMPRRERDAHKGAFGTVGVVAGSAAMLGAAILVARGALRSGAGLVRVVLPEALRVPLTIAVPCATTLARHPDPRRWLGGLDAVAVGPGLGATAGTRRLVNALLRHCVVPLVLDADALNVLAPLRRPIAAGAPIVLTPHPGEAARLLGTDVAAIQSDRRAAAAALARAGGGVAVLKGAGTLVCDGRRLFANTTGNPGMATGGSGDVLTGILAALLALGMEPFAAACLAVHAHGRAGDLVARRRSEAGLLAEDLPDALAEVWR
ncbi:MAG: NAD(P)H-hydrate dehydratase [Planctomycetes bacterium]|nr:NAD(P)H-hydrate dehydratase [Planctomycetota bacterium]